MSISTLKKISAILTNPSTNPSTNSVTKELYKDTNTLKNLIKISNFKGTTPKTNFVPEQTSSKSNGLIKLSSENFIKTTSADKTGQTIIKKTSLQPSTNKLNSSTAEDKKSISLITKTSPQSSTDKDKTDQTITPALSKKFQSTNENNFDNLDVTTTTITPIVDQSTEESQMNTPRKLSALITGNVVTFDEILLKKSTSKISTELKDTSSRLTSPSTVGDSITRKIRTSSLLPNKDIKVSRARFNERLLSTKKIIEKSTKSSIYSTQKTKVNRQTSTSSKKLTNYTEIDATTHQSSNSKIDSTTLLKDFNQVLTTKLNYKLEKTNSTPRPVEKFAPVSDTIGTTYRDEFPSSKIFSIESNSKPIFTTKSPINDNTSPNNIQTSMETFRKNNTLQSFTATTKETSPSTENIIPFTSVEKKDVTVEKETTNIDDSIISDLINEKNVEVGKENGYKPTTSDSSFKSSSTLDFDTKSTIFKISSKIYDLENGRLSSKNKLVPSTKSEPPFYQKSTSDQVDTTTISPKLRSTTSLSNQINERTISHTFSTTNKLKTSTIAGNILLYFLTSTKQGMDKRTSISLPMTKIRTEKASRPRLQRQTPTMSDKKLEQTAESDTESITTPETTFHTVPLSTIKKLNDVSEKLNTNSEKVSSSIHLKTVKTDQISTISVDRFKSTSNDLGNYKQSTPINPKPDSSSSSLFKLFSGSSSQSSTTDLIKDLSKSQKFRLNSALNINEKSEITETPNYLSTTSNHFSTKPLQTTSSALITSITKDDNSGLITTESIINSMGTRKKISSMKRSIWTGMTPSLKFSNSIFNSDAKTFPTIQVNKKNTKLIKITRKKPTSHKIYSTMSSTETAKTSDSVSKTMSDYNVKFSLKTTDNHPTDRIQTILSNLISTSKLSGEKLTTSNSMIKETKEDQILVKEIEKMTLKSDSQSGEVTSQVNTLPISSTETSLKGNMIITENPRIFRTHDPTTIESYGSTTETAPLSFSKKVTKENFLTKISTTKAFKNETIRTTVQSKPDIFSDISTTQCQQENLDGFLWNTVSVTKEEKVKEEKIPCPDKENGEIERDGQIKI